MKFIITTTTIIIVMTNAHAVPLIIAGSRDCNKDIDYTMLVHQLPLLLDINSVTEIVSGGARGADMLGERWANNNNLPVKRFPADWNTYGKAAGPIRNTAMAKYAAKNNGALLVIWDGTSRGTLSMINQANQQGIPVYIIKPDRFIKKKPQGNLF
ncbi:SLOG family protein [Candidatus Halobeggiatoa sp. HSG11]|nr:SLOG family protein [Candidatus Halobeggiatoa sp. HSG11]